MLRFLFGWIAWDITESAFWVGTIAGLLLVPTFVLSPFFGVLADRINPRNGLLFTITGQGALGLITAMLYYRSGMLELTALSVLAILLGAVTAAHTPIRLAMLPRLVERAALPSAIGYSAVIFNSSRIIGPAVGAWMLTWGSVPGVFTLSASIMFVAAAFLLRVKGITGPENPSKAGQVIAELKDGVRYTMGSADIRLFFTLTLCSGILGRTFIELLPAVSGAMLDGDATTLATLTACAGVGSILGGVVVSRQSGRRSVLFNLVLIGLAAAALVLLTAALWQQLVVVAGAVALISLLTTMIGTGNQALTQLSVDEAYRGRVMSLWTVAAMGTPAIGAVLLGLVADRVGFPGAFLLPSLVVLVLVALARRRGLSAA